MKQLGATRICIFCGLPPQNKTREHPLPEWLIALTGDPNRVVRHGFKWSTGDEFDFSFDQLVFPACYACNSRYATFESDAKKIVEAICNKEAVTPNDFVFLLDWLDKVRIGLWLGYNYLQGNPVTPNFSIDSRIGKKDRMVAVYTIGDHQKGLNTYGPETPLFQFKPSVFSLRVNNILFLNASWDWMCASRCGYPYPKSHEISLSHDGMSLIGDYRRRNRTTHPVLSGIMKPCVLLFQPVLQQNIDGSTTGISRKDFDHCLANTWPGRIGVGPLLRQFSGKTLQINSSDPPLEFDSVSDKEAEKAIDIATQAYSLQIQSVANDRYTGESNHVAAILTMRKDLIRYNRKIMAMFRTLTTEDYLRLWSDFAARK